MRPPKAKRSSDKGLTDEYDNFTKSFGEQSLWVDIRIALPFKPQEDAYTLYRNWTECRAVIPFASKDDNVWLNNSSLLIKGTQGENSC